VIAGVTWRMTITSAGLGGVRGILIECAVWFVRLGRAFYVGGSILDNIIIVECSCKLR
jgi:hypothetical protein